MPIGKIIDYKRHSFEPEQHSAANVEIDNGTVVEEEEIASKAVIDVTEDIVEVDQNGSELRRERSRVQPFEDVEDIFQASNAFMKRGESVIDVEIKLAKEKENEWRKSQGMSEVEKDDGLDKNAVIVYLLENAGVEDEETSLRKLPPYRDEAIKRLSEKRLKTEFLENQKREIDLVSEGKIMSVSKGIIMDAVEKHAYRSSYSKDELQGVSLASLRDIYNENANRPTDTTTKDEEELKSCKIQLSRSHFVELENTLKEQKLKSEKLENEKNITENGKISNSLKETKVTSEKHESSEALGKSSSNVEQKLHEENLKKSQVSNENIIKDKSKNGYYTDGNMVDGKVEERSKEKTITTNTVPKGQKSTSKTDDELKVEKKADNRRSMAPGRFARVVRHGDTENMIAVEIEEAKRREIELQKLRNFILETYKPQNQ